MFEFADPLKGPWGCPEVPRPHFEKAWSKSMALGQINVLGIMKKEKNVKFSSAHFGDFFFSTLVKVS